MFEELLASQHKGTFFVRRELEPVSTPGRVTAIMRRVDDICNGYSLENNAMFLPHFTFERKGDKIIMSIDHHDKGSITRVNNRVELLIIDGGILELDFSYIESKEYKKITYPELAALLQPIVSVLNVPHHHKLTNLLSLYKGLWIVRQDGYKFDLFIDHDAVTIIIYKDDVMMRHSYIPLKV